MMMNMNAIKTMTKAILFSIIPALLLYKIKIKLFLVFIFAKRRTQRALQTQNTQAQQFTQFIEFIDSLPFTSYDHLTNQLGTDKDPQTPSIIHPSNNTMNPSQDTVMHDALPVTQPPLPNTIALDDTDLSSVSLPSRNRLNARAQSVNNRKNAGESVELGTREEEKEEVTVENVDEELDEEDIEEEEEDEEDFDDEDDGEYGKPASSRRISKPVSRLPASASNPDLKPMAVVAHPKKQTSSGPAPVIYSAVYSGVEVYEMVVEDNPVMRRAFDSYMNATQLLKLAGFSKPKRTKILEKEIHTEVHEKIQGGFGKYQGTW